MYNIILFKLEIIGIRCNRQNNGTRICTKPFNLTISEDSSCATYNGCTFLQTKIL